MSKLGFGITDEGFERLTAAIVNRAILDYEEQLKLYHASNIDTVGKQIAEGKLDQLRRFFLDGWFALMMPHTDGEALIKKIEDNFKKYGKCRPYLPDYGPQNSQLL